MSISRRLFPAQQNIFAVRYPRREQRCVADHFSRHDTATEQRRLERRGHRAAAATYRAGRLGDASCLHVQADGGGCEGEGARTRPQVSDDQPAATTRARRSIAARCVISATKLIVSSVYSCSRCCKCFCCCDSEPISTPRRCGSAAPTPRGGQVRHSGSLPITRPSTS